VNAKLFGRHFRSRNTVRYLLERDVTRIIGRAVIWFLINAEGRETAIPQPCQYARSRVGGLQPRAFNTPHLGGWRTLCHNLKQHFVSSDKDERRAVVMPKKLDKNKELLTTGDRIALAFAALAILRLPEPVQQYINARDMLDIMAGEECWRQGYILGQAHHVLNTCTGFPLGDDNGPSWDDDDVEALFDEAFGKRADLMAEEEVFHASDKSKVFVAEDITRRAGC